MDNVSMKPQAHPDLLMKAGRGRRGGRGFEHHWSSITDLPGPGRPCCTCFFYFM